MFVTRQLVATALLSAVAVVLGGTGVLVNREGQPTPEASGTPLNEPNPSTPKDRWDDPLPAGAVARLGSTRFRIGGGELRFLPDNKTVMSYGGHSIHFWEAQTGKHLREIDTSPVSLRGSVVSRDGKYFAGGGFLPQQGNLPTPGAIGIWDTSSGKVLRTLQREDQDVDWCSLAFTPDDKLLASIGGNGILRIEDVETGLEILQHQFPRDIMPSLAISPDGAILAISSGPNTRKLYLWNWQAGAEPRDLKVPGRVGRALVFSPDGKSLAECGDSGDRRFRIWDVLTGRLVQRLEPPEQDHHSTTELVFSPDGKTFMTSSRSNAAGAIHVWDKATARPIYRLAGEQIPVSSLSVSPDGRLLAGISGGRLRIWDLASNKELTSTDTGHRTPPERIVATLGGLVATASHDFTIRLWESTTGKQRLKLEHDSYVWDIAVSPDGTKLASSSLDDTVCLWDMATGRKIYKLPGHGRFGGRRSVAFTPDSRYLLSWGDDVYLRKWHIGTGKAVLEHRLRPKGVNIPGEDAELYERERFLDLGHGTFSPDGKSFVLNAGPQYHIFDVATGKETGNIANEGSNVISLTISPDNKLFLASTWSKPVETKLTDGRIRISSGENQLVCLWELASGKLLKRVVLPAGGVGPVAFSPDSKLFAFATAEPNRRIAVWSVARGEQVRVIEGFRGSVCSLAFLPDGKRLVSGMDDTTALVWDLTENASGNASP